MPLEEIKCNVISSLPLMKLNDVLTNYTQLVKYNVN